MASARETAGNKGGIPWHRKLKPAELESLKRIRSQYQSGEIHLSANAIAAAIKKELSLDVTAKTVREWLTAKN